MNDKGTDVLLQYPYKVRNTRKGRGFIICETDDGLKTLKEYEGSEKRLNTEYAIQRYLKENEVKNVDIYMENNEGSILTTDSNGTKYVLKDYFPFRECDVKNHNEIYAAMRGLAYIHNILKNTDISTDMIRINDLSNEYYRHNTELKKIRSFVRRKQKKTEFDIEFLHSFDEFYDRCQNALSNLRDSEYYLLMKQAIADNTICHGNFNYHNILIGTKELAIINFEKFEVNMQISDVYTFMRKIMEKCNWNADIGYRMLNEYAKVRDISDEEMRNLNIRFAYPEKYFKIANYYYNTNKAWSYARNLQKLNTIINQNKNKDTFISSIIR